jgi:tripartite-type tricarboxylate transporter receptor subunit TctC
VAYAKANPGKLNFGYGQGSTPHLVGGLFKQETGIELSFVPYKGGAQAVTDMLGGHIHMNIGTSSTLRPLVRDGRLRALAVTGAERMPELAEVPTMSESGYPNVTSAIYYGILGPAGLPAHIVRRINDAANISLKSSELVAKMAELGFQPQGGSSEDFATLIPSEMKKWLPIVKATGFQM